MTAINIASAVDSADGALLPAVYGALESDLQMGPGTLGQLALYSSLTATLSLPIWGQISDRQRGVSARIRLLVYGCLAWALLTALTGFASNFWQLALLRSLNAAALAMINPVAGSLIADLHLAEERGRAFGINEVFKAFGSVTGAYLAGKSHAVLGTWRWAFFGFAAIAALASVCVHCLTAGLPPSSQRNIHQTSVSARQAAAVVCRSGTFRLIVLHGIFGAIPYHALGFLTLWFQSGGVKDAGLAAVLGSSLRVGSIVGNLLGGKLGDIASQLSRFHGRVYVAQSADVIRLPLVFLLFHYGVQNGSGNFAAMLLFLVGCVAPWVSVGANRPILSEIVSPRMRARVFGYQLGLEGISASVFGAPLVGHLAESVYGYHRPANGQAWQRSDHLALGNALFVCVMYPWVLCAFLFSLIHLTYPAESERVSNQDQQEESV